MKVEERIRTLNAMIQLLREEIYSMAKSSRKLLAERDSEISELKKELDKIKGENCGMQS